MERGIAAAGKHQPARRREHAGRAGDPEHRRQLHVLQRGMTAQRRHVAKGHPPFDRATIQIQGHEVAVRRFEQRHAVHEVGVGLADADHVRIHFRRPRIRARPVRRADACEARLVGRLENEHPGRGIERRTAPVRAADDSRPLHGAAPARRREHRTDAVLLQLVLRRRLQFRREIEGILQGDALLGEGGRPRREGLRRPGMLAVDIARRHRAFFDRPDRLAGDTIEHEREPLLRELHDGVDGAAAVRSNRHQIRRRRVVVVPQAMMHDLVVPFPCAGIRVEADEGFSEQIRAGTPPAVKVVARRAKRHVDEAAIGVERHRRPGVGVAGEAPRISLPGVVAELARLRDGVKRPHLAAGARVERADIAGRIVAIDQAIAVAEDDEILVHHRRRRVGVVQLVDRPHQPLAQIDRAVRAE